MRSRLVLFGLTLALAAAPVQAGELKRFSLGWWGADAIVEQFADPQVPGVACFLSRTEKGGVMGYLGLANNSSHASIACRQVGPMKVDFDKLDKLVDTDVFSATTHWLFKSMHVRRVPSRDYKTLVYLVFSETTTEGSDKTAITAIPIMPWPETPVDPTKATVPGKPVEPPR